MLNECTSRMDYLVRAGNGYCRLGDGLMVASDGEGAMSHTKPKPGTYFLVVILEPGKDKASQDARDLAERILELPGVDTVATHKAVEE